ncbi:hypothetical protein COOONC_06175, partial [Cooperia oncophora]
VSHFGYKTLQVSIPILAPTNPDCAQKCLFSGSVLPYQYHVRVLEFFIILAFAPIEAVRLSWGIRGNLTETPAFLAFSLLLSVPTLLILVYLAIFQNYGRLNEMSSVGCCCVCERCIPSIEFQEVDT